MAILVPRPRGVRMRPRLQPDTRAQSLQLNCLGDNGHPHEVFERFFGSVDRIFDRPLEVLGAPADERDFLEHHAVWDDNINQYKWEGSSVCIIRL